LRQSNRFDQHVKSKHLYVSKYNLGIREKNVKLHIEVVNVINIASGNDSRPYSLGGNVVAPTNDTNHEDNLEGCPVLLMILNRPLQFKMLRKYKCFS